jgi:hypothetical protein
VKTVEQRRVVIVDGYSTGHELLHELLERNVECLHIQSEPQLPAVAAGAFDRMPYDGDLGYVGRFGAAIRLLADLEPDAVVAGSEWGVTFAERVAHGLGLPSNMLETIDARRNKYEMIEAARRYGLQVAEQVRTKTLDQAQVWANRQSAWPIVVKPLSSTGSDGVTLCYGPADINMAFNTLLGHNDLMGAINDRLLLQSFLQGPQYIINTVSRAGRHIITDAWDMPLTIQGANLIPQGIHLLDPELPVTKALIDYTLRVLAALGVRNGAAHTELKWTSEGPALIETGARLMAAAMDRAPYSAAGLGTQASAFARALVGSDADRSALFDKGCYTLLRHMTVLLFNFQDAAQVQSLVGLERLRELPSFQAHYRPIGVGDLVWRTAEQWTCGGVVYLVHDNRDQITADIEQFRAWERRGQLYGLGPRNSVGA